MAEAVRNCRDGWPYDVRRPVKEVFESGYTQVINRTDNTIIVSTPRGTMTLPKNSFVAWSPKTGLWALSSYAPGTEHRIDYAIDPSRKVEFVNPRGGQYKGFGAATLLINGKIVPTIGK